MCATLCVLLFSVSSIFFILKRYFRTIRLEKKNETKISELEKYKTKYKTKDQYI